MFGSLGVPELLLVFLTGLAIWQFQQWRRGR
jgi:hypothetical protein